MPPGVGTLSIRRIAEIADDNASPCGRDGDAAIYGDEMATSSTAGDTAEGSNASAALTARTAATAR